VETCSAKVRSTLPLPGDEVLNHSVEGVGLLIVAKDFIQHGYSSNVLTAQIKKSIFNIPRGGVKISISLFY
jgi:hypothetical protein